MSVICSLVAFVQSEIEAGQRAAAEAAAALVNDGMTVGLGTGSTVAYLLPALAERRLRIRCVATSVATFETATALGIAVEGFAGTEAIDRLDIAIDGADQVAPDRWLVKGGGGAHTREKAVAAAADRFVVIVSPEKLVPKIVAPVPVELASFGLAATLRRLPDVRLRSAPLSPGGGMIADYGGEVGDPGELAAELSATVGIIEHGLFGPAIVSDVIVGRDGAAEFL